jgi:hypothetical protein
MLDSQLGNTPEGLGSLKESEKRQPVAIGEGGPSSFGDGGGNVDGRDTEVDDLQARLDKLRKD